MTSLGRILVVTAYSLLGAMQLMMPAPCKAQGASEIQSTPLPAKLPGGIDKVFDVLGLTTGMSCRQAVDLVQKRVGRQRITVRGDVIRGTNFSWIRNFEVSHDVRDGAAQYWERLYLTCSGFGSGNQVIEIKRYLVYPDAGQVLLEDLMKQLTAKYGAPNAAHGIAYYFGRDCPDFAENQDLFARSRRTYIVDDERVTCIFGLRVWLGRGLDEKRAGRIDFVVSDFLRGRESVKVDNAFERAIREEAIRNTPTTSAPKL